MLTIDADRFLPEVIDAIWYIGAAHRILQGHGLTEMDGSATAYFAPGYSGLLAAVVGTFGNHVLVPKLFNVALGTLTTYFTYELGRRVSGTRAGLIAAALYAVWPGMIAYTSLLLSEVAFQCVFTGALMVFFPPRPASSGGLEAPGWEAASPKRVFAFGVVLGCAAMVRGIALAFLPVPILLWGLCRATRAVAARNALLMTLGVSLTVAPWMLRNHREMGMVTFSTDGSLALIHAHSPLATGGHVLGMQAWRVKQFEDIQDLPRTEREVAMSKAQMRYAIEYWLTHPLQELSLIPRRFVHFYAGDHWAFEQYNFAVDKGASGRELRVALDRRARLELASGLASGWFFVMLALAGVGAWRMRWSPWNPTLLIPATVLYFTFAHSFVFFGSTRFHAPLIPLFALLAAQVLRGRDHAHETGGAESVPRAAA